MARRAVLAAALILSACNAQIGDPSAADGSVIAAADAGGDAGPADASVADATPPDAMPCVDGDANVVDPMTGSCYMLFTTISSWEGARLQCEARSAHLVVSTSMAENDVFSPLAGVADVWAGGTDAATEGAWLWITGEPMTYTNWRSGEPNNGDISGEDCMVIEGDNGGLWDDRACDRQYGYICERP